jgi:hypothetical protein
MLVMYIHASYLGQDGLLAEPLLWLPDRDEDLRHRGRRSLVSVAKRHHLCWDVSFPNKTGTT